MSEEKKGSLKGRKTWEAWQMAESIAERGLQLKGRPSAKRTAKKAYELGQRERSTSHFRKVPKHIGVNAPRHEMRQWAPKA